MSCSTLLSAVGTWCMFAVLHVRSDATSPQQAEISSLQQLLLTKNAEIENLHTQLSARPSASPESSERGKARRRAAGCSDR